MSLFIVLLAPFVRPVGLDYFPLIGTILTAWKLLALVYLAFTLLPRLVTPAPRKESVALIGLAVFWGIYLVGCLRVGQDVVSVATAGASSFILILLIFYETRVGNGMLLLKAMSVLFTFYIVCHILSVFAINGGLLWMGYAGEGPIYLFGMDNYSAFFIYPMLSIVLYYKSLRYGTFGISGWLLIFGVIGIYLFTKSLTAAGAGVVILLPLLLKRSWSKLPPIRNVRWVIVGVAVLLVLICGFQVQNLVASLLDSVSKGVTLNSRTYIWDYALRLIKERPLFGYGAFTETQLYKDYILYGTSHAHNLLLELLLRTGVVGAVGFLLFLCGFAPFGKRRKVPGAHGVLMVGLVGQLVLFFMDFYPTILVFYIFMGVLYCSHGFNNAPHPPRSS